MLFLFAAFKCSNYWRDNRHHNNADSNQRKMGLEKWHITQYISCKQKEHYPGNAANNVVQAVTRKWHAPYPGNKWGYGTDDGHKSAKYYSLATMLIKESFGLQVVVQF